MNLYKDKNAKQFSDTRNRPWEGWSRLLRSLQILNPKSENLNVLDLGCGNGRFGKFLSEQYENVKMEYIGVDNSEDLLGIARKALNPKTEILNKSENQNSKFQKFELINLDLDNASWELSSELSAISYELVVAFGLLHHLTSFENHQYLITKAFEYLVPSGILVLTFWMFKENQDFMDKHVLKDLGNDDYMLSFNNEAERFCHYSSTDEIKHLIDINGVEIIDRYRSDGFGNKMNEYILLRKF